MRLAGQSKGGFYPYHNDGVRDIAALLTPPPDGQSFRLLDPCCGNGLALATLAAAVGCVESDLLAAELEDRRVETARSLLPAARVVGPASFLEMKCDAETVSAAWVNPPYDNEIGGGYRVETSFVSAVSRLIMPGGLLILVVPEKLLAWRRDLDRGIAGQGVSGHAYDLMATVASRFRDWAVVKPQEEHRPFKETVLIAVKRPNGGFVSRDRLSLGQDELPPLVMAGHCERRWRIPPVKRPGPVRLFEKGGFTERELYEAVASSDLWRLTEAPPVRPPAEPLLPLSKGHLAMMLASGFLDGVVRPPGEEPHVVRGTAQKEWGAPQVSVEEDERGNVTKTVVKKSEKIKIAVRVVAADGEIKTLA